MHDSNSAPRIGQGRMRVPAAVGIAVAASVATPSSAWGAAPTGYPTKPVRMIVAQGVGTS